MRESGWMPIAVGAGLALLLGIGALALFAFGVFTPGGGSEVPERLLVIATAPGEQGGDVATFAFVLAAGSTSVEVLDTTAEVTVAGTSASTPAEAFAFGGGSAVSESLATQTGGEALPWIVLGPRAWTRLVDEAGGLEAEIPESVSAYRDGELVLLSPGKRALAGNEALALAAALPYIEGEDAREQTTRGLEAGLSALVAARPAVLAALVGDDSAQSSEKPSTLADFAAGR